MISPSDKPLYSHVVATSRNTYSESVSVSVSSSSPSSVESNDSDIPKLGVGGNGPVESERFQIDRRRLEKMIKKTNEDGLNCAESFFENISDTTETFVTWPRNLKLDARSRKDPHVRIVGRKDDITWAKGLILAHLAPRGSLLKMKMSISSTDHPHIIGRGGGNVNRIMEETETHIHFPDTNRRTQQDKSNQVSIYGSLESLERARNKLRQSTPLAMTFVLPAGKPMPRHDTQFVRNLEENFHVKVMFFSTPRAGSYVVLVKGPEVKAVQVKEAAQKLIDSTCGPMAPDTLVTIEMDISQQLFDIITREGNTDLFTIMETTQTSISFPEPEELSPSPQVTITGSIDGVYVAKHELIGCLPIELTFDIPENHANIAEILSLGNKYGVSITTQQKSRDNNIAVTVKGAEKNIHNIYEAHQEIHDMQIISSIEPELPKAYLLMEPAYRRLLENNVNSDHIHYEGVAIWAPTGPVAQSNFLHVKPSTGPISISLWNNFASQEATSPNYEPAEARAVLSPDSTDSSEAAYQDGRRSSDWVVMKPAEGTASEDDDCPHFECDFDLADLEVASIFMSASPTNDTPMFSMAPGAERRNRW